MGICGSIVLFDLPVEIAKMSYTHLTREERYQIYALKKAGLNQADIASHLDRSGSTISSELSRNHGRNGYRPKQAHAKSVARRAINARRVDEDAWEFAQEKLLQQ